MREIEVQDMESNTFKSVTFGGFAKQDVIDYIEKMARESAAAQDGLRRENEELKAETEALKSQVDGLRSQLEVLNLEHDRLTAALETETARARELEPFKPEAERLAADLERLRPDAVHPEHFRGLEAALIVRPFCPHHGPPHPAVKLRHIPVFLPDTAVKILQELGVIACDRAGVSAGYFVSPLGDYNAGLFHGAA